jgi:hypothetical protein
MPCKVFLRADSEPIWCQDAADIVVQRIQDAGPGTRFVQVQLTPNGHGDTPLSAYICPADVSAILPIHPKEMAAELENPPEWFEG